MTVVLLWFFSGCFFLSDNFSLGQHSCFSYFVLNLGILDELD